MFTVVIRMAQYLHLHYFPCQSHIVRFEANHIGLDQSINFCSLGSYTE